MSKSPLKILLLVLLVVLLLLPMHWLPAFTVGDYEVKRISIVSDIVPEDESVTDTFVQFPVPPPPPVQKTAAKETQAPTGLVQILDYDQGEGHGMAPFYEALHAVNSMDRPIRIAYFGDSFIEADLMTSSLRDHLQNRFGGRGVGYVDIAPPYASMRSTVQHRFEGWKESCVLNKGTYKSKYLNISQRYFVPDSLAWTEVKGVSRTKLDSAEIHTLFLASSMPHQVHVRIDKNELQTLTSQGTDAVEALTLSGRAHKVRWQVQPGNGVKCFGLAEESRRGVILDNFSLRGSSGMQMASVGEDNMRQWNKVRPYDLIVLQYGLNVANKKQTNYSSYALQMKKVIERLKKAFPEAGILIVGVGDRGSRDQNGDISTMPGIVELSHYQQQLAADTHVAFWNLYEAMGGKGAMKRMAEAKPAEAAKDYTHITNRGGHRVATLLFNSIAYGYEQFK